jgi:hypothetical protein
LGKIFYCRDRSACVCGADALRYVSAAEKLKPRARDGHVRPDGHAATEFAARSGSATSASSQKGSG